MKIAKENYKPSDSEFDNIIDVLYKRIGKEATLKKEELGKSWLALLEYYRTLEDKELNSNKFIFKLEVEYKSNVYREVNNIHMDFMKFDLFIELLAKRDNNESAFIDIKPSDSKNRLNKSMVRIFKDKELLNNFISIIMGTILTDDYESFYAEMCELFHFKIKDMQIKHFSIYSKMSQILTNDLFNLYNTKQEIKNKSKPDIKIYSTSKYGTHSTHYKRKSSKES